MKKPVQTHDILVDGQREDAQLEVDGEAQNVSGIDEHGGDHNVLAASHHFSFDYVVIARVGVVFRIVLVHYASRNASNSTGTAANAHASDPVLPHFDRDGRRSVGITAVCGQHARRVCGLEDVVGLLHAVEERGEEAERRRHGDAVAPLDDGVERRAGERVDRHIEVRRGVGADFPRCAL